MLKFLRTLLPRKQAVHPTPQSTRYFTTPSRAPSSPSPYSASKSDDPDTVMSYVAANATGSTSIGASLGTMNVCAPADYLSYTPSNDGEPASCSSGGSSSRGD